MDESQEQEIISKYGYSRKPYQVLAVKWTGENHKDVVGLCENRFVCTFETPELKITSRLIGNPQQIFAVPIGSYIVVDSEKKQVNVISEEDFLNKYEKIELPAEEETTEDTQE